MSALFRLGLGLAWFAVVWFGVGPLVTTLGLVSGVVVADAEVLAGIVVALGTSVVLYLAATWGRAAGTEFGVGARSSLAAGGAVAGISLALSALVVVGAIRGHSPESATAGVQADSVLGFGMVLGLLGGLTWRATWITRRRAASRTSASESPGQQSTAHGRDEDLGEDVAPDEGDMLAPPASSGQESLAVSISDELLKFSALHSSGVLTDAEFSAAKEQLLTGYRGADTGRSRATPPAPERHRASGMGAYGVAAVACGALSFLFLPILFGPSGVVLGVVERQRNPMGSWLPIVVPAVGTFVGMLLGMMIWG